MDVSPLHFGTFRVVIMQPYDIKRFRDDFLTTLFHNGCGQQCCSGFTGILLDFDVFWVVLTY